MFNLLGVPAEEPYAEEAACKGVGMGI